MGLQDKPIAARTKEKLKTVKNKVLHNDGFFYTLLRSSLSSQLCGWIDTLTAFLIFSLLDLSAWLSTAIGAFVGGVFNCIINYRFTFHAYGVDIRAALVKFA
ncbi:MAG: GtrA family protein, partial [Muribaculaceae bacterium]|nr:GtrA family protein [Muribaculaceae bacterium]